MSALVRPKVRADEHFLDCRAPVERFEVRAALESDGIEAINRAS
jgi:hypothetical protein